MISSLELWGCARFILVICLGTLYLCLTNPKRPRKIMKPMIIAFCCSFVFCIIMIILAKTGVIEYLNSSHRSRHPELYEDTLYEDGYEDGYSDGYVDGLLDGGKQ